MKEISTRVFTENGTKYCFDCRAFASCMKQFVKEKRTSQEKAIGELASMLNVSPDAVKNWKYGKNGPSAPDMIRQTAEYLHVDWTLLTKQTDGGNNMTQLTERQKDAAKRIYDILIWFLEVFSNTDGFSSFWTDLSLAGEKPSEEKVVRRIEKMEQRVGLVLNQEYFDLHDHEIYDEFCEFASEDLTAVYEGKTGYGFRYEADGEHDPTVWQDYEKTMQRLNGIIERYI